MSLFNHASKVSALPILRKIAPGANKSLVAEEKENYLAAQRLALRGAKEIAAMLAPGWTEKRAAKLLETYLRDHGVKGFFHFPFAWWGERTRFVGVSNYYDYLPSNRVLCEDEPFILDVAPILNGYIADIGYSGFLGKPTTEWLESKEFLYQLRDDIPALFSERSSSGAAVWREIDGLIKKRGFENIHEKYPFSVLGHRVHKVPSMLGGVKFINFGWQSYWSFTTRGIFGQLLNHNFEGDLQGLWAVEPHLGGHNFGSKFEEILVIDEESCSWLEQDFAKEGW